MKKLLSTCLVCATLVLGITGCGQSQSQSQSQPQPQQQEQQAQSSQQNAEDELGTVEPESADTLVAKFNTEIMDNGQDSMNPASTDFLTVNDDQYWYGLLEDIYLVVVPEQFTGTQANDIVDMMLIYVDKTGEFDQLALTYATYLIVANNPDISADEAAELLTEAKDTANTGKTAISGKGITVGYLENDNMYQYQVIRVNA